MFICIRPPYSTLEINVFITVGSLLLYGHMLRSILPYLGDERSIDRLQRLDKKVITVFAIIALSFSKVIEGIFIIIMNHYPVVVYGVNVSQIFWYLVIGTSITLLLVFGFDVYLARKKQQVVDTIDATRDTSLDEYTED